MGATVTALPPVPVAGPLLVFGKALPRKAPDIAAILTALAAASVCAAMTAQAVDGPLIYWFGGRVPRDGQAIGIAFAVDQAGGGFATVIGGLFAAALVFAWGYFNEVHAHFHVLMLVFMTGMIGFCLTHDVFNMFVWFESPTDEEREKNDWPLWLMLLPALALLAWSCVDAAGAGRIAPSAAATLMPPGAVAGPASPQTAIPVAVLAWLSVGLALLLAACQLSWRHLPGWLVGNVQRVLNPLGAGLRFLHDGAVGDYIAWAVVSLALLTAAFGLS